MSKKEKEDQRPAWLPELSWQPKIPSEVEEEALRLEMGQIQARFMEPGRPPTEAEASSLRLEAGQIMHAEELLKSSPGHRGKNEFALKKKLREARGSFISHLYGYGLESYRWPDGFSVRILPPREEGRAGSIRSRLIFDQK
jgi:hypothetical protein